MNMIGKFKLVIRSLEIRQIGLAAISMICTIALSSCAGHIDKKPMHHYSLQQLLLLNGGRMSRHAGQIEIVVPNRMIFSSASATTVNKKSIVLQDIAAYLGDYNKGNVYITSYYSVDRSYKKELTKAKEVAMKRVKHLEGYLLSHGVDARLIVAGSHINLDNHGKNNTKKFNYRNDIVIKFSFLPHEII